jgi:hypothetical protein
MARRSPSPTAGGRPARRGPAPRRTASSSARVTKVVRGRRSAARRIDLRAKGAMVLEPSRDNDPEKLDPRFRTRLLAALASLAAAGTPFRFVEGFRSVERQQWLFGQGRPAARPFGRPGAIVTHRDGVRRRSNHQGTGSPGTGCGADCYPVDAAGKVFIPPAAHALWKAYAAAVKAQGLKAGLEFPGFADAPHCELVEES